MVSRNGTSFWRRRDVIPKYHTSRWFCYGQEIILRKSGHGTLMNCISPIWSRVNWRSHIVWFSAKWRGGGIHTLTSWKTTAGNPIWIKLGMVTEFAGNTQRHSKRPHPVHLWHFQFMTSLLMTSQWRRIANRQIGKWANRTSAVEVVVKSVITKVWKLNPNFCLLLLEKK